MITLLKKYVSVYKKTLKNAQISKIFYNSAITTSCCIPNYKIRKKIWVLEYYDATLGAKIYYWITEEQEAIELSQSFKSLGYFASIKEYELEL